MSQSRSGFRLKALGVCVLALLSLTAFMAAGAQAEWLVGGGALGAAEEEGVKVKAHTEGILTVPSKKLDILCTTVAAGAGTVIKGTPLAFMLGVLNFTNCQTFQNKVLSGVCKPVEPVVARGKGQVIDHNGEEYVLLSGDEEISAGAFRFAKVDFPEACSLPDTNVAGSLVLECLDSELSTAGKCLDHTVSHLVQEAPSGTGNLFASDGLLYGINAATISGIADAELTKGAAWSAHV